MIKAFRKINSSDRELMAVQTNVEQTLGPLSRLPILDGTLLTSIAISTSDTQVSHKLGRIPQGYMIAGQNADARIWQSSAATDQFITLKASSAVITTIWVF